MNTDTTPQPRNIDDSVNMTPERVEETPVNKHIDLAGCKPGDRVKLRNDTIAFFYRDDGITFRFASYQSGCLTYTSDGCYQFSKDPYPYDIVQILPDPRDEEIAALKSKLSDVEFVRNRNMPWAEKAQEYLDSGKWAGLPLMQGLITELQERDQQLTAANAKVQELRRELKIESDAHDEQIAQLTKELEAAGRIFGEIGLLANRQFGFSDNLGTLETLQLIEGKIIELLRSKLSFDAFDANAVDFMQRVQAGELTCIKAAQVVKASHDAELARVLTECFLVNDLTSASEFLSARRLEDRFRWNGEAFEPVSKDPDMPTAEFFAAHPIVDDGSVSGGARLADAVKKTASEIKKAEPEKASVVLKPTQSFNGITNLGSENIHVGINPQGPIPRTLPPVEKDPLDAPVARRELDELYHKHVNIDKLIKDLERITK